MNFKLYIFGESSGYKQYPDDSVDFRSYYRNQQTDALLTIKRNEDLVYYVYTQRIDKEQVSFLGFCLVFNGVYIKKVEVAFSIFEKAYSDCILGGKLFKIGKNGKIGFATEDFSFQLKEIDRIVNLFNDELEKKNRNLFVPLPKTYKVGLGNKSFAITDGDVAIGNAISCYDSVLIPYSGKEDESLDYIGEMVQQLYTENKTLKADYAKLNRRKKQYRWVAILSVMVIASLVGLYLLNDNLSGVISNQNTTIDDLRMTLADRDSSIVLLRDTIAKKKKTIVLKEREINRLGSLLTLCKDSLNETKSELASLKNDFPIRILSIDIANAYSGGKIETDYGYSIYSKNTMYLTPRISYVGVDNGKNVNLKVRWYTPDGSLSVGNSSPNGFSQQQSLYIHSGYNTITFSGWGNAQKGHWGKGKYRIEIWYNDICLKSKTFIIQ